LGRADEISAGDPEGPMRIEAVAGRAVMARVLILAAVLVLAGPPAMAATAGTETSLLPVSAGGACRWQADAIADEDAFVCPGAGGYSVLIRQRGVDSWPEFGRGGRLSDLRDGIRRITGADVVALTGAPMEWRFGGGGEPRAALFQVQAETDAGSVATLYVVARLSGGRACIAGRADSPGSARRLADGGAGCR
jgi:hypothetical protein